MIMEQSKRDKILFRTFTGLLTLQMLLSAGMYFLKHEVALEAFVRLGFPPFIIYPLGIAKILGIAAIVSGKSTFLAKLAYAGFFYNMLLAISAHLVVGDGVETIPSSTALLWVIGSYYFNAGIRKEE